MNYVALLATVAPHPFPLPIGWGEGGRRPGEGLAGLLIAMTLMETL